MGSRDAYQERRSDLSRRQLFAAGEEIFGRLGYHRATIGDITRAADLGLGTFYLYFPGKLDVFGFILRTRRAQWTEEVQRAADGPTDDPVTARRILTAFFGWIMQRPTLVRMFRDAEYVDPALIGTAYVAPAERCVEGISRAIDTDVFRAADSDLLAWYLMGVAESATLGLIAWRAEDEAEKDRFAAVIEGVAQTLGLII